MDVGAEEALGNPRAVLMLPGTRDVLVGSADTCSVWHLRLPTAGGQDARLEPVRLLTDCALLSGLRALVAVPNTPWILALAERGERLAWLQAIAGEYQLVAGAAVPGLVPVAAAADTADALWVADPVRQVIESVSPSGCPGPSQLATVLPVAAPVHGALQLSGVVADVDVARAVSATSDNRIIVVGKRGLYVFCGTALAPLQQIDLGTQLRQVLHHSSGAVAVMGSTRVWLLQDRNGFEAVRLPVPDMDGRITAAAWTSRATLALAAGGTLLTASSPQGHVTSRVSLGNVWVQSMVVSPDDQHLYIVFTVRASIQAYSLQGDGSIARLLQDLPGPFAGTRCTVVAPDGRHLYLAVTHSNHIAVLRRDAQLGTLTLASSFPWLFICLFIFLFI